MHLFARWSLFCLFVSETSFLASQVGGFLKVRKSVTLNIFAFNGVEHELLFRHMVHDIRLLEIQVPDVMDSVQPISCNCVVFKP